MTQEELYAQFDKQFNAKDLAEQEKAAAKNDYSNLPDVPAGEYTVSVQKMELRASKKGKPMVSIQFKITQGQYKNRMLFYNQVIDQGFGLHNANEFLKSMELDCVDDAGDPLFKGFAQYGNLILDAYEEITSNNLTYDIDYSQDEKGFNVFEITAVNE